MIRVIHTHMVSSHMTYLKILSVTNTKWSRIVGSPVNKELGMIWPWSNVVYGAGIHVTIDF